MIINVPLRWKTPRFLLMKQGSKLVLNCYKRSLETAEKTHQVTLHPNCLDIKLRQKLHHKYCAFQRNVRPQHKNLEFFFCQTLPCAVGNRILPLAAISVYAMFVVGPFALGRFMVQLLSNHVVRYILWNVARSKTFFQTEEPCVFLLFKS